MNYRLKIRIMEQYRTQADFAQEVGVADSVVSRVVCGRRRLDPKDQQAWAEALDCRKDFIFPSELPHSFEKRV